MGRRFVEPLRRYWIGLEPRLVMRIDSLLLGVLGGKGLAVGWGEVWVPHVDDEDAPGTIAVVPHLVDEAVVESEALPEPDAGPEQHQKQVLRELRRVARTERSHELEA